MRSAHDPESVLRLHARNVARINARYVEVDEVLRQAAPHDPVLADLWKASEQERLNGAAIVIDDLLRKGRLKDGVDRQDAVDVLWLLMAPDQLGRLRRRGWSIEKYEAWLAESLITQLLP